MRLHNTLTRKTEELIPQKTGEVTLYTCGPTVYNYYHIGNLRNAVFNDTLRRALAASGLNVHHVMNITDVGHLVADEDESVLSEDKLEKGASREGKTVKEVAEHYTAAFKRDMAAINVLPPNGYASQKTGDTYARATEFIAEQLEMVKILLDKEFAYQTKQAIYFDVTKLPDYGALSGQKLSDKEVAVRADIVTDPEKHHPYDFAVWFFTVGHFAEHSMKWSSPWGEGFPGWHLECSAIIHATLGDPIDIHTGGVDHIGTHHANEIAQTEAAFGHPLANFWVHNEFVLVDGAKMSKSKGNSYTLKDLTQRNFSPLAYRLLVLQAHYRSELNFSWESLEAAQNRLIRLRNFAALRYQGRQPQSGSFDPTMLTIDLQSTLKNDLDTPGTLANIEAYIAKLEGALITNEKFLIEPFLEEIDKLLGLELLGVPDITPVQKQLIAERESARAAKDWLASDELRHKLRTQNLEIDDTPSGPRWRRTTV